jgi:hypothetical protein
VLVRKDLVGANLQPTLYTNYIGAGAVPLYANLPVACDYFARAGLPGSIPIPDLVYLGVSGVFRLGSPGASGIAASGSALGIVSTLQVLNCSDGLSEQAGFALYQDYANNNNAAGNKTPGRAWGFDAVITGAILTRQSALGGFHVLIGNYVPNLPLDNLSGALADHDTRLWSPQHRQRSAG